MNNQYKIIPLILMSILLGGCANAFKKPGDLPVKSPCEVCKKKPFYINGRHV